MSKEENTNKTLNDVTPEEWDGVARWARKTEALDSFRDKLKTDKSLELQKDCPNYPDACFCTGGCQKDRLKAIAQNGNVGYFENDYERVERDYAKD